MQTSGGPSCEPDVAILRTVFPRRSLCEKKHKLFYNFTNTIITITIVKLYPNIIMIV